MAYVLPLNPEAAVLFLLPLTFALALLAGPRYIKKLREFKIGKQIRVDGPTSHLSKAGTPTMGGWLIIAPTLIIALIFVRSWSAIVPTLLGMLAFGLIGAIDDRANLTSAEGLGLRVRHKFVWHIATAFGLALILYRIFGYHTVVVPLLGSVDLGWWFVPLAVLVIFATTSGVNEADGLDGLAAGATTLALSAYLVIAWWHGQMELAALASVVIGATLAFLWFNCHPAAVFMGDTGSLALGAALALISLQSGAVLLLPLVAAVFVVELLSVIIQVGYFKLSHGRRIFRMSPLHHHFELSGVPEVKIVQRLWLVGALAAAAGVAAAII